MKRPNGTGSVEVLPDGRARVRIRLRSKRTQLGPIFDKTVRVWYLGPASTAKTSKVDDQPDASVMRKAPCVW